MRPRRGTELEESWLMTAGLVEDGGVAMAIIGVIVLVLHLTQPRCLRVGYDQGTLSLGKLMLDRVATYFSWLSFSLLSSLLLLAASSAAPL